MRIIYTGIQKEYYNSRRGFSFEYNNFYLTLKTMPSVEVIEYPYDSILTVGKKELNNNLLKLIRNRKPDLFFAFMFTDELDKKVLDEIKKLTTSLAWFSDDHWRLWNYSRYWAPHFTWVVTTWSKAPEIYRRYGITNIIRSQWACNPKVWHPTPANKDIDVSFVGQYTSARGKVIRELRRAGVPVVVRGWGWPDGRLSQSEIIEFISRSKINLNLNTPPERWRWKFLGRLIAKRSINRIVPDVLHVVDNLKSWRAMSIPQIKARPFEILGCNAFLISGYADDMKNYYEDGKEIVYYDGSTGDLIEKINYYLPRAEERERIAKAGYERTLREHIYEKRFEEIFTKIGLKVK